MRDLSLHILDLVENSIRAEATIVWVTIAAEPEQDLMTICVEDNGHGLAVPAEVALDPFYTTKPGKRTGLGLSLFREAAEQAGGKLVLRRSALGGLAVEATMRLTHLDRSPLGDVAATISSVVCTNPHLDVWCTFRMGERECTVKISDVIRELSQVSSPRFSEPCGLAVAREVSRRIRAAMEELELKV